MQSGFKSLTQASDMVNALYSIVGKLYKQEVANNV